jgi:hypothetical protein
MHPRGAAAGAFTKYHSVAEATFPATGLACDASGPSTAGGVCHEFGVRECNGYSVAAIEPSGLTIAIAGGAGAFLGATVGQAIQWVRELQTESRIDRRRAQDRAEADLQARRVWRHEDYLRILTFVQKLHDKVRLLASLASTISTMDPENEKAPEVVSERRRDVAQLVSKGLSKATARAEIVGSSKLRQLFVDLNSSMMGYAVEPELTNKVKFMSDEKLQDFRRRKLAGEDVDFAEALEEKQVEWSEMFLRARDGLI